MFLVWSDEMSVGHSGIDDDHKKLISIINRLHEAIRCGRGDAMVGTALSELADYTAYHFGREEWLMESRKYPFAAQHQQEHLILIGKLTQLISDFEKGLDHVTLETMNFMKQWFLEHTSRSDLRLARFLRSAPTPPLSTNSIAEAADA